MRVGVGFGAAIALLLAHQVARGNSAEPLRLAYEAPAVCPDADAFFAEVLARTPQARAPTATENARTLRVRIAEANEGRGFVGHLHFEEDGADSSPRAVEAPSCSEVVAALALVAALAVDAHAAAEAPPPPPPRQPAPPTPAPVQVDRVSPSAPAPRETRVRVGAQAVETAGADGVLVFSARVFADVTFRDRQDVVAPSLRAGFSRSTGADIRPLTGRATLTWTEGALEGCPLRFALGATIAFRPCAEVVAGVVDGAAEGVSAARDRSRPWVEVDAHGRFAWDVLPWIALEAEGGPTVPLVREEFVFTPGVNVYQAPIIALFGRAGVAVRFR